ncbi:hypothetical protein [[Eubacterium] cellulosolvens]
MTSSNEPERVRIGSGRKELRELIQTSRAIGERKFNPFFLDVALAVETLRKYFPFWDLLEDHCLDAETINNLAEVLNLQKSQLRFQSSVLYTNPEMLEKKFRALSVKRLGEIFLKSWHPIVEREQLTSEGIREGLRYWDQLLSYEERRKRLALGKPTPPAAMDLDSLVRSGILTREDFANNLRRLWEELRAQTSKTDAIDYWSFVRRDTYQETVQRAYYVSFLLTYGFAKMVRDDAGMKLISLATPTGKVATGAVSYPIAIPRESEA